jgi:L-fuculose-phosphate aldolase
MASMGHMRLRRALVGATGRMNDLGINQGVTGNVSARAGEAILITPAGVSRESLRPVDIVEMRCDGSWRCAVPERRPSSEWRLHLDILRARREFGAVLHCHAVHATALSCLRRTIPAFHYMVAVAGGNSIRCAPYATFGTAKLSRNALKALEGRSACLLANHGVIACGVNLDAALALAVEVESLAAQYAHALQIGKPKIIPDAEMHRVLARFKAGYADADLPDAPPAAAGAWAAHRPGQRRAVAAKRRAGRR